MPNHQRPIVGDVSMFRLFSGFFGFGLLCCVAGSADSAPQGKHVIAGTITEVKTEKGHTVLTIKSHGKDGKAGKNHHVTVNQSTKVEVVSGKKGGKQVAMVSANRLHAGEHVVAHLGKGHHADRIDIHAKKKKT